MENRSIFGIVEKRSKGKIKIYYERWAILISSKPLFEDFTDESILENSKIPPWMELDTLYYFKLDKVN
jgi:hypothetical protein